MMGESSILSVGQAYTFRSEKWRKAGLTHSSLPKGEHFERLEFLGDRVLGAVMADWVYDTYPKAREGELSKLSSELVSREQCARVAHAIGLVDELKCAKRIDLNGSSVLGNALEAWLGAIYQDGGFEAAKQVILLLWKQVGLPETSDYKTKLQEWLQAQSMPLPVYEVVLAEGPEHCCMYTVEVETSSYGKALGKGPSRKKAEHAAAKQLLKDQEIL